MKPKFKVGQVLIGRFNENYYARVVSVKPGLKSFVYVLRGTDFIHEDMGESYLRALTKRERGE